MEDNYDTIAVPLQRATASNPMSHEIFLKKSEENFNLSQSKILLKTFLTNRTNCLKMGTELAEEQGLLCLCLVNHFVKNLTFASGGAINMQPLS